MTPEVDSKVIGYEEIDAMLEAFEAAERKRLQLDQEPVEQWSDPNPQTFTRAQRDSTTILFGGLTLAHDEILTAALGGRRYHVLELDVPNNDALRFGKEFGNRGQCNPTYFTVGNLVKHLVHLRHGIPQGAPRRRLRRLPRDVVPAAGRPPPGERRRSGSRVRAEVLHHHPAGDDGRR